MFRPWSDSEKHVIYGAKIVCSDSWNSEEKIPVFTSPPPEDLDIFSRIKTVIPELENKFPNLKLPSSEVTYSTAMLNAEMQAERIRENNQEKKIRNEAQAAHAKMNLMKGVNGTRILTTTGKPLCIIQGYRKFKDGGEWFPPGDKYSNYPPEMIDNLSKYFEDRESILQEAKIYYNRASGKNRLIFHFQNGKIICDRREDTKLLLR